MYKGGAYKGGAYNVYIKCVIKNVYKGGAYKECV